MGILFALLIWGIGAFIVFTIIYYGVRMGIDSSETSLYIKKIHDMMAEEKDSQN